MATLCSPSSLLHCSCVSAALDFVCPCLSPRRAAGSRDSGWLLIADAQLRAQCLSVLCLALLMLQLWLRPYRLPAANSNEARCLTALCIVAVSPIVCAAFRLAS